MNCSTSAYTLASDGFRKGKSVSNIWSNNGKRLLKAWAFSLQGFLLSSPAGPSFLITDSFLNSVLETYDVKGPPSVDRPNSQIIFIMGLCPILFFSFYSACCALDPP